jgi:heterodisulfide reductase subunit C
MPTDQRNLLNHISTLSQHLYQDVHTPTSVTEVMGLGASACKQCGYCTSFRPQGLGGNSTMCVCGHYRDSHYGY